MYSFHNNFVQQPDEYIVFVNYDSLELVTFYP